MSRATRRLDGEQIADRIVHGVGLSAGLAGAAALLVAAAHSPVPGQFGPLLTYAVGLLAMLGCSAAYHVWHTHRLRPWLRRLDHAAIFAMIAGTYTPIGLLALRSPWDVALTTAAWVAAGTGMALKLFRPHRIESISIALYLLLGWMGLAAAQEILASVPSRTLLMIVIGGLVYSGGILFHRSSRRYNQALWHGSVLVGASCHYLAIAWLIQP